MTKNEKMRARYIFDNKKDVNTLYMTSDSQFFVTESAANAHSKELKDTSVVPVNRAEVAEATPPEIAGSETTTTVEANGNASADNAGTDVKTEVSENTGSGAATPSDGAGAEENKGSGTATPADPLLRKTKNELKKLLKAAQENRAAMVKDKLDVKELDESIAQIEAAIAAKK